MIKLHQDGTDLYTIKQITSHQDFKSLERYVEIDSDQCFMNAKLYFLLSLNLF